MGVRGLCGRRDSETTGEERRPRASPQPPRGRATSRASTSRDSRAHRHRKVTREEATLHNLPPRRPGTRAPSCGARAGPCGGGALSEEAGRPGPVEARSAARSRGWRTELRDARVAAAEGGAGDAGRGPGGLGAGRGPQAPGRLPAPSAPPAAPPGTAPRRTCLVPYLSGFVELLLEPGHRHGAGGRAGGCGAGIRRRRSRAGGPSRTARCPGRRSSCSRRGCGRGGAELRGTRARAERHPDVRGG